MVNLKEEIKQRKSSYHYIPIEEKEEFLKVIKEIEKENLFDKHKMLATYIIDEQIVIGLYRDFYFRGDFKY